MILSAVIDIDPENLVIRELGELAFKYGLFDMTEILLFSIEALRADGQRVMMVINKDTRLQVIQTLLACSVLGFASWKYETYEIVLPSGLLPASMSTGAEVTQRFKRNYTPEVHRTAAVRYLSQAKEVILGYEAPMEDIKPAE